MEIVVPIARPAKPDECDHRWFKKYADIIEDPHARFPHGVLKGNDEVRAFEASYHCAKCNKVMTRLELHLVYEIFPPQGVPSSPSSGIREAPTLQRIAA